MDEIAALRARLDAIDRRIVQGLAERLSVVAEVARHKQADTASPRDPTRERALLARLDLVAEDAHLDPWIVRAVYRTILDHSVRLQEQHLMAHDNPVAPTPVLSVAYQGTDGCYSHIAARAHMATRRGAARYRGHDGFRPLLESVASGDADLGFLPIENTTAGTITESYDLLARMSLSIVGEEYLKVEHCLIALAPLPLHAVRRVRSHPMALAQCTRFLDSLTGCLVERYPDTAMACDALLREADPTEAAIASALAAEQRGLTIIARDIGDQEDNITRFVVVARDAVRVAPQIPAKTSLVLALRHEQGALNRVLSLLSDAGLSLTKLESRPRPKSAWEYLFYIDIEGNAQEPETAHTLEAIRSHTPWMKVLGTYPRRER